MLTNSKVDQRSLYYIKLKKMAAISCQQTFNNSRQVIIEAFNRGDIGVKQAEAGIATASETYRKCMGRNLVGRPGRIVVASNGKFVRY